MCTGFEGAMVAAALSGAGTLMQMNAADEAADRQRRIINQAAEENRLLSEKKAKTIEDFTAKTFNASDRLKNYENAATTQETNFLDALNYANGENAGEINSDVNGRLSSDYDKKRAEATANATADILKRARLMARTNATGLLYNNEALKSGNLVSDLGLIDSDANRVNRYADNALGAARNNGSLVGGLLSGVSGLAGQAVQNKVNTGTFSGN